jgi:twinkle protein
MVSLLCGWEAEAVSDARQIKELLRARVAELALYLYPNGRRESAHWCVGSVNGEPGKSFKICLSGDKAGLWGDFADSEQHRRSLLDL